MSNWVDEMIASYTDYRRELSQMKKDLNPENNDDAEAEKMINSMIRDMSESIEWMETGRDPKVQKGIHVDSIYHVKSYGDMDLIPDIIEQLEEESINERELFMTKDEKIIMGEIIQLLSARERQCYFLHVGHKKSMGEIAVELGVSKSTVQTNITRARNKMKSRVGEAG